VTGPQLVDGRVEYVDRPGLGVEIDEDAFGEPLFTVRAPR
jgi:L-alanine-DL-glutamate epimerase-like enolase superfamily enzyme